MTGFGGRVGAGERAALLVVDMSAGFTDPASPLACDLDDVVAAIARLVDAARRAGTPVIFTTVEYTDEGAHTARHFLTKAPALRVLEPGSRWAAVDERLAPAAGEPVLTKVFASAFWGTDLADRLQRAGVDTVVVCGASTSGCVRATVVDALQHGHRVLVPEPAVGDRSADAHAQSLRDMDGRYADVVSLDEALRVVARG